MGRYGRTMALIAVIVIAAGLALGFQRISLPNFKRGGDTPLGLSLGLDLQGGIHLVYQANLTDPDSGEPVEVTPDQMESLQRAIERRVNSSGLGEPIIQILGEDRLLIQLPGVTDRDRAVSLIGETARLEFKRRELNVSRDVTEIAPEDVLSVSAGPIPGAQPEPDAAADAAPAPDATAEAGESQQEPPPPQVLEALETAIEEQALDQPQPKLLIEFSDDGAENMQAIYNRLSESFRLYLEGLQRGDIIPFSTLDLAIDGAEFQRFAVGSSAIQRVPETNIFAVDLPLDQSGGEPQTIEEAQARVGESATIVFTEIQGFVDEDTGLTGDDLARAFPGQHATSQLPIVNLEFDDEGTRIFGELTIDIVRKAEETGVRDQIAIFLDGQELISPQVNTPITAGTAIIEGGADFTIERVRDLSLLLESGRLPVPITLIQERDVDAILGADSLAKSVVAGFVGLGLVLAFMTLYYRLPGLMASFALVIYAALVLAIFKLTPVTLTLSGVAALILSIGMAVDANILIFERMKDELRAGRTLLTSINIGFDRAWPAIRDGNVSTLITCAILFWFADQLGASIVQGFAVTLAIGVGVSMFTAITVSRTLLRFIASVRFARGNRLWLPSGGGEIPQPAE